MSAHDIGAVSLVEVGARVYSRTRRDSTDYPLGGLVVEIVDHMDHETGEIHRAFRTLALAGAQPKSGGVPAPPVENVIEVDEVNPATVSVVSMHEVSTMMRTLCAVLGDHRRRKRLVDMAEMQLWRDIQRLGQCLWPAA